MLKDRVEAGCDEAGRGCLAGPVTAAAVILNPKKRIIGLDDSKKLTRKNRELLRLEIEEKAAAWAVAHVAPERIDEINILNASFEAMLQAAEQISMRPDHLLIDGNRFKGGALPYTCVIKGDGIYQSIAAASILAKTHRDSLMRELHETYPDYGWKSNKGYPSKAHRLAIREVGVTPHHRRSFRLLPDQLSLF